AIKRVLIFESATKRKRKRKPSQFSNSHFKTNQKIELSKAMAEESPNSTSEVSVIMTEQTLSSPPNLILETQTSTEATIASQIQVGTESTCNNIKAESSAVMSDGDREKTLEFADDLMDKGSMALKQNDFGEAAEFFSRALEIRVAHYGELALECVNAYYQYGRALLYKSQDEADPLGAVPKKEGESDKDGHDKNAANGETSVTSVSSNHDQDGISDQQEEAANDVSGGKDLEEEEDDGSMDDEDLAEAEEDDSDLDLAWKMLDVARAIAERHPGDTMEKVDILSVLAEVSLEREDIETSLSDYQKALIILERLVEPDSRLLAALNFQICLCLEIGSKPQEAVIYCMNAISICKSRLQRLKDELKSSTEMATEIDDCIQQSSNGLQIDKVATDEGGEIESLVGLLGELEKKLEDLQHLVANPKSILAEILGMASARTGDSEKSASLAVMSSSQMGTATSNGGFDSPTVSTAHTNGAAEVTHLGVVGRGVKRVLRNTSAAESVSVKKPTLYSSLDEGDGSAC
ncbi:TPR_1 domain-containing protein/SHNi-TPR domain-containing protein, partial [Cephalotus follicularis]